jgi:hypothetical protein
MFYSYYFYNIIKFKKDITEKECLVVLHGQIGMFITVLQNWLKLTFFRPLLRRKRRARKGGGHQDDRRELDVARTSRSRRPQRCRFAPQFSAIFTFLCKKVVYPLDNLGASSKKISI